MAAGSLESISPNPPEAGLPWRSEFDGIDQVALRVCAEKGLGPLEVQLLLPGETVSVFVALEAALPSGGPGPMVLLVSTGVLAGQSIVLCDP